MLSAVAKEQENIVMLTSELVLGITCELAVEACQNSGKINAMQLARLCTSKH